MNNIRLIVRNMVPNNTDLYSFSSSEIVEHICDGIYKEDTYLIRDKEILNSIPQLIRDCVLLIDSTFAAQFSKQTLDIAG